LVEGSDFLGVVLQLAHGCADLGVEIGLVGDHHAANSISLEVLPDEFIWISVGRIGRKIKQPQSAVQALDKSSGLLGNVGGPAINNQEDWPLGTSNQALQKVDEDPSIHAAFFFDHEPHVASRGDRRNQAHAMARICRAIGLPGASTQVSVPVAGQPPSTVAWTAATLRRLKQGNAVRGAALATTCNNCHGSNGVSADAAFPHLVGQSVAGFYKQLDDFKSGKRNAAVMGVYVSPLSEQDVLDLATYFASLPNPFAWTLSKFGSADAVARHPIEVGNPMRGMAPCAACHGPLGHTLGAPDLRGQQGAYLEQQMQAFAAGNRRNDIGEQMRSVARRLTGEEIAMLAAHYSSAPRIAGR
jgi:cytochrome c553